MQFIRARDETEQNAEATTASYLRDEVSGPLKGLGKEEVTIEKDTVVVNSKGKNRIVKELKKEVKVTTPQEEKVSVKHYGRSS